MRDRKYTLPFFIGRNEIVQVKQLTNEYKMKTGSQDPL